MRGDYSEDTKELEAGKGAFGEGHRGGVGGAQAETLGIAVTSDKTQKLGAGGIARAKPNCDLLL